MLFDHDENDGGEEAIELEARGQGQRQHTGTTMATTASTAPLMRRAGSAAGRRKHWTKYCTRQVQVAVLLICAALFLFIPLSFLIPPLQSFYGPGANGGSSSSAT